MIHRILRCAVVHRDSHGDESAETVGNSASLLLKNAELLKEQKNTFRRKFGRVSSPALRFLFDLNADECGLFSKKTKDPEQVDSWAVCAFALSPNNDRERNTPIMMKPA